MIANVRLLPKISRLDPLTKAIIVPTVILMPGPTVGRNSMKPANTASAPALGMPRIESAAQVRKPTVIARTSCPRKNACQISPTF